MLGIHALNRTLSISALLALALAAPIQASAATVAKITLTVPHATLSVGASETLVASAKDSTGHTIAGVAFTWSSSSPHLLSITSKGVAKGLAAGKSTIKVTGGGKSASVVITVAVASITLTTPSKTLLIGNNETLTAVAKDTGGHVISGVKFTWTSSKSGIVSITSHALATAMDAGKSKITVTGGGKSVSVNITVPTPSGLSGVAAQGAAIAGATVTLVDSKGATTSTTTASDGSYALDTTGLIPPFLVSVQVDDTHTLYSVSADASTASVINVNPLTDLIIRSWYSVQGSDVGTAFTNPVASPPPSVAEVQLISNVVVNVTALWLQQNGVDTTQFNPISTLFAVGDGVDTVLDETTIDTTTGAITITDGTTTQNSTVTYDTGAGSMTVDNTTTNSDTGDQSISVNGTVVDTTTDMQTALAGITTALNAFSGAVTTNGIALTATELLPYLDKNLISEGLNKTQFADSVADQFRQYSSVSFAVQDIVSLDTVHGLADVNFSFTATQGDQSQTQTVEFFFKQQSDLSWRLYGDQLPAKLGVDSEMRTSQGAYTGDSGPQINVDIRPIQGAYTAISINGGSVFSNASLNKQGTEVDMYTPDPSSSATVTVTLDEFFANSGVLGDLVPVGTPLTITMTPTKGSPQQFTVKTNAFTTEAISITNLSGSSFAGLTKDSAATTVEWTLPKTFAIAQVKLSASVFDGDQTQGGTVSCDIDGPILSINATTGGITIPSMCAGGTVTQANISINVTGVNGEKENVIYMFQ